MRSSIQKQDAVNLEIEFYFGALYTNQSLLVISCM